MEVKQKKVKVLEPHFVDGIEGAITEIYEIEDEDTFYDSYISHWVFENQHAKHVKFDGVIFKKVTFINTKLNLLSLSNVRFIDCDLSNLDLSDAIIHRVEFVNCKLMGLNLTEAALQDVHIDRCNGKFALMSFTKLKNVIIADSNFDNSTFTDCKLTKVQIKDCSLLLSQMSGTSLKGIDLSDSMIDGINLRIEDIKGAIVSPMQAVDLSKLMGLVVK